MLGERGDEIVPFPPIFGRSDVLLVPKSMKCRLRSEIFRHEAYFDEWFHAICQQAIVDLVYIRKVVDGLTFFVFAVNTNLVVKDRVKTNVFKISDFFDAPQI